MQFSFAQQKTVTGTVTSDGAKLPGATVSIAGTQQGTQTDENGKFSIKANQGDVLEISFLDKETKTVTVGAGNVVNVVLATKSNTIEAVQIVGAMGIKRTKDAVVAAQKQIGSKELTQAVNPNAIQALTGKVSGLQINTVSNGVNAETRIVLRGNRSVTGDNQALIVIDNAISSSSVLSQLPPDVIESINVIKGAQGAALYGAQGVNGVLIVTTKKGSKSEKFSFGVNSSIDFENVNFVTDRQMDYGQGWATDAGFDGSSVGIPAGNAFVPFENGSWGPAYNDPTMPAMVPTGLPQQDGNFMFTEWKPIKDNIKQFFKTGTVLQNGFNFSVGGPTSYSFLSVNRQTTDFVVVGDQLKRTSFLFKAGKKIGKFNIDGNVNYITQNTSETNSGLYGDLLETATNIPVERFGQAGGLNQHHWTVYATSPYWISKNERFDGRVNTMNGILNLGYELNKNISVNYTANLQMINTDNQSHNDGFVDKDLNTAYNFGAITYYTDNAYTYTSLLNGGGAIISNYAADQSTSRNYYGDLLFNFNYDLTDDLNLKFNIGNNIQDRLFRITSQGGENLGIKGLYNITNVLNPTNPNNLDNREVRQRRVAGFANVDLGYKDYLFLNATGRVEQSSTVKGSYFYPSVGVSFIPTKAIEALKDNSVLNYAKLNATYTSVGNTSAVNPYAITNLASIPRGFPYGDLVSYGYNLGQVNADIKPEFVNTLEFGGQLGFFKDRVTLEGSYFMAETKDLITRSTTSSTSGGQTYLTNIGDLENKGFEIDLGLTPIKNDNFRWDIRTSYSTYKTVVTSLQKGVDNLSFQTFGQVGIFAEVGEEFPLIKGTSFVRDGSGNVIVDANGNPLKTSTFEKLGKATPDYIIGLTNSFEYKGFKLTAVADFRTGGSVWTEAKQLLLFTGGDLETSGFDRTQGYVIPGSVTTTGAANTVPVANDPTYAGTLNYFTTNYRFVGESNVVDATALKIRELSLSYALPKKVIEKAGLETLRFGVNARNPFIFLADGKFIKAKNGMENHGYGDPEASNTVGNAQGLMNVGQYPTTRTLGFSVNLTF
jgi:TonB-linked SusC/RagA family outer membrane protein